MTPAWRSRIAANLSMLFTELPLIDRFEAARRAGFQAVEIQFPYEASADDLRAASLRAALPIVLFNVPAADLLAGGDGLACVPGAEGSYGESLAIALEYAAILAPRCINVLAGRAPSGVAREDAEATFIANLRRTTEAFGGTGIEVVVEALNAFDMPRFLLTDHAATLALIERSDTSAKVQYDVYHQARMGRDVVADLRRDVASIAHVQVADVPQRSAPGTGELDFRAIFAALDEAGYPGFVGAEYKPYGPTEPTLDWFHAQ